MTEQLDRFNDLSDVLEFANQNPSRFTLGQKILIHQERARLLSKITSTPDDRPPFTVPPAIDKKIQEVLAWINRNNPKTTI